MSTKNSQRGYHRISFQVSSEISPARKRPAPPVCPVRRTLRARAHALVLSASVAALSVGCAKSYDGSLRDVSTVESLLASMAQKEGHPVTAQGDPGTPSRLVAPGTMMLPMVKARYCLERAREDYRSWQVSAGADMTMIILAGVAGGIGTSMAAAAATMDATDRRPRRPTSAPRAWRSSPGRARRSVCGPPSG